MGNIVWIASYPKSGNTWTRMFLLNLFMAAREPLSPDEAGEMSPGDGAIEWFRRVDDRPPEQWTTDDVARLRPAVHADMSSHMADTIFIKTHSAMVPFRGQPMFNMQVTAGAIYLVRNPLDVAPSYAKHSGLPVDDIVRIMSTPNYLVARTELQVEQLQGGWSQHVASWTANPHPALHVVRYEDLVADPVTQFGAMCRFLGLDPEPDRLRRAIDHTRIEVLRELEAKHGFRETGRYQERFFNEGRAGGWRDKLSENQARRLVERHRVQMTRFGYVPEGW